jgi:hypothetical protein
MFPMNIRILLAVIPAALAAQPAPAHVPYLEEQDFTREAPYVVRDVGNSKSISARLESAGDVDFYAITLERAGRIHVGSHVPYCAQYADFAVTMALVGPGLPQPALPLPVTLAPGEGALVLPGDPGAARTVFLEPFSGRRSWTGPRRTLDPAPPGKYVLLVWNERGHRGDYIAVIGEDEYFGPEEIAQARHVAPLMAHGRNLMVNCDPTQSRE